MKTVNEIIDALEKRLVAITLVCDKLDTEKNYSDFEKCMNNLEEEFSTLLEWIKS